MAVNLAIKYAKQIANEFSIRSVVDGTTNKDYDFQGVRGINIYTPVTQSLNDYQRSGINRYGTPTEMQDALQEMTLGKDRSFSITIDKGNNSEQMDIKSASQMLALEIKEQVVPEMDKYALLKYIDYAGTLALISTAPTKSTIVGYLSDGMVAMSNAKVPSENRYVFIEWSKFGMLRQSPEFIGNDDLGKQALVKGALGMFMGAQVVPVPDDYMKKGTSECYFLIYNMNSVIQPKKIQDYFAKDNPAGINGSLLEGRFIYDAFVLGARANGVYAAVASGTQQAAPTNTYTAESKTMAVASTGATAIRYTLDGSDPRYSKTALVISGASGTVDLTSYAGTTVTFKSVAMDDALFTSAVTTTTQAVAA